MAKSRRIPETLLTAFSFILLVSVFPIVQSISINPDGYYDIVVAIHEKTAQNDNDNYLDNLKAGIEYLSASIYESTRKFSIRYVDIVLPDHWDVDADSFVTTQSYLNADIRIYHDYLVPQAINPTFCGSPGLFIELPYPFFDEHDNTPYGPTGKALLTLWARYRWGIYEEHGYSGDPVFPYWWKHWQPWQEPEEDENGHTIPPPDPGPQPWKLTDCSNTPLLGNYKTLAGEPCGPRNSVNQDEDDLYPPASDCRFYPNLNLTQGARSSLMSFPFVKSLTDFCDERTHNKLAPNRQNFFCQYKSAWEVIRESRDWKQLKEDGPAHQRVPINFRILKKSDKPLLFILNDAVNKPPEDVMSAMESKLDALFEKTDHWNTVASVASFPSEKLTNSYMTIYPWNTPWYNRDEFLNSFRASFGRLNSTHFRDFGSALHEIANHVKTRDHKPGAIIVMIKYGTEEDYDLQNGQWPLYQGEVIGSLVQTNIRLFVLEGEDAIATADSSSPYRLKGVPELTGGLHLPITGTDKDAEHVNTLMEQVDALLTTGQVPLSNYRLAFKEFELYDLSDQPYPMKVEIPVLVHHKNVKSLSFYFYSRESSFTLDPPVISEGPDGVDLPQFAEFPEWGKDQYYVDFKTHFAKWEATDPLEDFSEWVCTSVCVYSLCNAGLVVIAELEDGSLVPIENEHGIQMQVFTSAEGTDNEVDLSVETAASLKGVAFSVYAKLERNGHPINSPDLEVKAYICHYRDGRNTYGGFEVGVLCTHGFPDGGFLLKDNGPWSGDPDLIANDGIFSGNYIPTPEELDNFRGTYHIYVTARLETKPPKMGRNGPLPIDQELIRCGSSYEGCWSETINEPFFLIQDLGRKIDFVETKIYSFNKLMAASRILDFKVVNPTASPGELDFVLEWTEPGLMGAGGNTRADAFQIYFSHNFYELLDDVETEKIDVGIQPSIPGRKVQLTVTQLKPGEKRWYKMRSTTDSSLAAKPVWSNIVFVYGGKDFFELTTTTSTTTTPPPTTPTTRRSTTPKKPATAPSRTTFVPPTTTTKKVTRPTVRSTTEIPTTTPQPTTTFSYEITREPAKRWYKSPEAIATFSVFGVLVVAVAGGVLAYMKLTHRV